jgi:ComF family protein
VRVRAGVDALLAVLIAPRCAACERPHDAPSAGAVCSSCWDAVVPFRPPCCDVCGCALLSRQAVDGGAARCKGCTDGLRVVSLARAVGEYDGALRDIIQALKYGGRRSIAPRLSAMMRLHGTAVLSGADRAVPVPLHWRRQWRRGFNQAAELAAGLGLPVSHALKRQRDTRSQTDLPAGRRRANVRGAFRVTDAAAVADACVVLVDDVSTTGATLDACATVLLEAGAREVRSLTAARVSMQSHAGPRR